MISIKPNLREVQGPRVPALSYYMASFQESGDLECLSLKAERYQVPSESESLVHSGTFSFWWGPVDMRVNTHLEAVYLDLLLASDGFWGKIIAAIEMEARPECDLGQGLCSAGCAGAAGYQPQLSALDSCLVEVRESLLMKVEGRGKTWACIF